MNDIFLEMSVLLAVTTGVAFAARAMRQPPIVAYILSGILAGPFVLNLFSGDHVAYRAFAEFGVVLLLFVIGLNLNFSYLRSIGRVSIITGVGQAVFTAGFGFLILLFLGFSSASAIFLAVAATFSSTIIILKLLSDKKETDTVYGRHTIGLMLVQDVIAVVLIVALGMVSGKSGSGLIGAVWFVSKLVLAGGIMYLASRRILPKILDKIAGSSELLFIFTLSWCFGAAALLYLAGFSLEIGAVAAGIALSSSPYQLEIGSRVKPLRDFFLVLFFIVLGSEMSFSSPETVLLPAVVLSIFILVGNPLILYFLFRRLRFTRQNSFLSGLTAAQVSEFGFVLLFAGRQAGYIRGEEVAVFTVVALFTIFVSSYLISYNRTIYRFFLPFLRLFGPDKHHQSDSIPEHYDVWVVGYHRIGRKVVEVLKEMKTKFCAIDFDPGAVSRLRRDNVPFHFGDIADVEFLDALPISGSRMVIMTVPSVEDQISLIKFLRKKGSAALVVGNAYHQKDTEALYAEGADFVMMPHLVGGEWLSDALRSGFLDQGALSRLRLEQAKAVGF